MSSKPSKKNPRRLSPNSTKSTRGEKATADQSRPTSDASGVMLPELKKVLTSLRRKLDLNWKRDAFATYEIGAVIAKVKRQKGTYGSRAVETLAEQLKLDKATLYRWAVVATTWPKSVFAQLMKRRGEQSELPLSWSHFEVLTEEKDSKRRGDLLERALSESLTVLELRMLIKGASKKTQARTHPVAAASTVPLDVWNRAHDLVEEQTELTKALASIAASSHTPEQAELAKELYSACEKLMAAIKPIVAAASAAPAEAHPVRLAQ